MISYGHRFLSILRELIQDVVGIEYKNRNLTIICSGNRRIVYNNRVSANLNREMLLMEELLEIGEVEDFVYMDKER